MTQVARARSLLFVPGDRPDRFDKAGACGADAVIIDLEDAVPPERKPNALRRALAWLSTESRAAVRINPRNTTWHRAEVRALRKLDVAVVLPKTERPDDVAALVDAFGPDRVVALLETPRGIVAADAIAEVTGVVRLAFGNVDLAAALAVRSDSTAALAHARGRVVLAAASAGLPPPLDGVTTALHDEATLIADVARAREVGFGGKLCIHPRQVPIVNAGLLPGPEEVEWARRVVDAEAGGGVTVLDGSMIDAPEVARAKALLHGGVLADDGPLRGRQMPGASGTTTVMGSKGSPAG